MCCVLLPVPVQFFLMLAMGNDYLLYYIVPLHTFYFLVVYLTMAIAPRLNRTKWGIRGKLAVLALIMYCRTSLPMCSDVWLCSWAEVWHCGVCSPTALPVCVSVWEVPSWFDTAFRIIEVAPGGGLAKLHDWHFRTFLDHYSASCVLGMVWEPLELGLTSCVAVAVVVRHDIWHGVCAQLPHDDRVV